MFCQGINSVSRTQYTVTLVLQEEQERCKVIKNGSMKQFLIKF